MSQDVEKKKAPAYLFALGHKELPAVVEAGGARYHFAKLFKHDFFAATALYQRENAGGAGEGDGGPGNWAVLKVQRVYPLFGIPMKWLGRIVARHELGIYQRLQGVRGVPAFLGEVGATGFLHAFVPGEDLRPEMPFTPLFFDELHDLLGAIHAAGIAYVDTNKRENILFGEDGRPWLIDFQISFWARKGEQDNFLAKWILHRLQREDWYHFYKHKTRLMPQHCTADEVTRGTRQSWCIRAHRFIAQPIIQTRRRFLSRYKLEKVK